MLQNLFIIGIKLRQRSKTLSASKTLPNTPINLRSSRKLDQSSLQISLRSTSKTGTLPKQTAPKKAAKRVIINNYNIIEHTPPFSQISSSPETFEKPSCSLPAKNSPYKVFHTSRSAPDYRFLDLVSGVSGEKDYKQLPKKSFIEDGGMSVLPMSTGWV